MKGRARTRVQYVIGSTNLGGAESMLLALLAELDADAFSPHVCIAGGGPLVQELEKRRVPCRTMRTWHGFSDVRFLMGLAQAIRGVAPDVIHSHLWMPNYYSTMCGLLLQTPVLATFHSNDCIESVKERLALRAVMRWSRTVAFVCQAQRDHFAKLARLGKVEVIRNGLGKATQGDSACVRSAEKTEVLRKRYGGGPIVVCVANFRPVKGHKTLLQGWKEILEDHPVARLVLVGDGVLRDELTRLAGELGVSKSVVFAGTCDDVNPLLAGCDVFVVPSLSECLSYAVMEAMNLGCPIVVTKVGGNPELIVDGEHGFVVPAGEPERITEAVGLLLRDKGRAIELGRAAQLRVRTTFSATAMARQYEGLYSSLRR